jgi:hypothetical protein
MHITLRPEWQRQCLPHQQRRVRVRRQRLRTLPHRRNSPHLCRREVPFQGPLFVAATIPRVEPPVENIVEFQGCSAGWRTLDFGLRRANPRLRYSYNFVEISWLCRKQEQRIVTPWTFLGKSRCFNGFHRSTLRVCYIFSIWGAFMCAFRAHSITGTRDCVGDSALAASAQGRKSEKAVPWWTGCWEL